MLEKNNDAKAGYEEAADQVDNIHIKEFFLKQAQERNFFGEQLSAELNDYGEQPEGGTSFLSGVHRVWMNIRSSLGSNNAEDAFIEAMNGEKKAIEEYNQVIKQATLPPSTKELLINHRDKIQNSLDKVSVIAKTW